MTKLTPETRAEKYFEKQLMKNYKKALTKKAKIKHLAEQISDISKGFKDGEEVIVVNPYKLAELLVEMEEGEK